MKNLKIIYSLVLLVTTQVMFAQVGIGTVNPEVSAILDIHSTEKGFLLPRMTEDERNLIGNPANGLIIYNTTSSELEINNGSALAKSWESLVGPAGPAGLTGSVSVIGATGGTYNNVADLNAGALGGTYSLGNGINSSIIGGSTNLTSGLNSSALGGTTNQAIGINSSVVGGSTIIAENLNASAIGGTTNTASGINSTVIGGITNFAYNINSGVLFGIDNQAFEINSCVLGGAVNSSNGINSNVSGGTTNNALGLNSVVSGGTTNTASGINSGAIAGTTNAAIGINAIVFGGSANLGSADYSIIVGGGVNSSNGEYSAVLAGYGNKTNSYGELTIGLNGTNSVAISTNSFEATDRIFSIGNGIDVGSASNALIVLKSGLATLPSITNIMINAASEKVITTKEYTDATYSKYGTIAPTASLSPGIFGEIRVTADYTYTCIATDTWRRVKNAIPTPW